MPTFQQQIVQSRSQNNELPLWVKEKGRQSTSQTGRQSYLPVHVARSLATVMATWGAHGHHHWRVWDGLAVAVPEHSVRHGGRVHVPRLPLASMTACMGMNTRGYGRKASLGLLSATVPKPNGMASREGSVNTNATIKHRICPAGVASSPPPASDGDTPCWRRSSP